MAKRQNDFSSNIAKKQKTDCEQSIWEDDFDDACFDEIATKVLEKQSCTQLQNSLPLPSYNDFRPNISFVSTQKPKEIQIQSPTTAARIEVMEELKLQITYLQQKCESRDGEVSILRSQLQQIKTQMSEDKLRKEKEFQKNLNTKDRKLNEVTSDLELKKLEIIKLKSTISEAKQKEERRRKGKKIKLTGVDNKTIPEHVKDIEIFITEPCVYPLLTKLGSNYFQHLEPEIFSPEEIEQKTKDSNSQMYNENDEEYSSPAGPTVTIKLGDKSEIGWDYVHPEMMQLMQCRAELINSNENKPAVQKIVAVTIHFVKSFNDYLEILQSTYGTEDLEQMNNLLLKNFYDTLKRKNHKQQIGLRCGKLIVFVAELILYCPYLADYIFLGKSFNFSEQTTKIIDLKNSHRPKYFVTLLNDVVKKILQLGKTDICYEFLRSVSVLLINCSTLKDSYQWDVTRNLLGSLLFTRPPVTILINILTVFSNYSSSKDFLEFLCSKPNSKKIRVDKNKKLQYFTEESCKFSFFGTLLMYMLSQASHDECIEISTKLLFLASAIFITNPHWMHDQQINQCSCLELLYQLIVDVLYRIFLYYKLNHGLSGDEICDVTLKNGLRLLKLLIYNSFDVMERHGETHSKFHEIYDYLEINQQDLNLEDEIGSLQKFNLLEDVVEIPNKKLSVL